MIKRKGDSMKSLISMLIVSLMLYVGCQENSNIVEPQNKILAPNWIELPKNISQGSSIEMEFSASDHIYGYFGGDIKLNKSYYSSKGKVKIYAKIEFDNRSFSGDKFITMTVDDVNGTVTFSPSMIFDKPAKLNLKLEGLDLSGINPENINFVYLSPSGTISQIVYKDINVDVQSGTLELIDGQIPHFSRFGFVR